MASKQMGILWLLLGLHTCWGQGPWSTAPPEPLYMSHCRDALGMHSGDIPDSAISASSAFDLKSVGPLNSRIRKETNGGAWCPLRMITPDIYEYLEIDLGQLKVISMVETQGRFGNGQGAEYTPKYLLEYQRTDGGRWIRFHNRRGEQILDGNTNTFTAVTRELSPPIIARRLRFIPYTTHPRTICLRVEVYGCRWTDGVVSYSLPQGERRGTEVDLRDTTYDGQVTDGQLTGGLGQLTDMEEGISNFRLDNQGLGRKGYEWVGWKNDSAPTEGVKSVPIDIVFEFDQVYNFSAVRIHCNNLFTKDVRVFRMAEIYFSVGGKYFASAPVEYEYMRDLLIEFAREVVIPIPHRVGRFVKVTLHFDSRWMLISEVKFDSKEAVGVFTTEAPPPPTTPTDPSATTLAPWVPAKVPGGKDQPELRNRGPQAPAVDIVAGASMTSTASSESTPVVVPNHRNHPPQALDDTYIGIIIGTLCALILLLTGVAVFFLVRKRRNKYGTNPLKVFGANLDDLTYGLTTAKVANGNCYNAVSTKESEKESEFRLTNGDVYREPCDAVRDRKLPDLPESAEVVENEVNTSRDYATPDLTKYSPLVVNLPPRPVYLTNDLSQDPPTPNPGSRGATPPPLPSHANVLACRERTPPPPPRTPPPPPTAAAMGTVAMAMTPDKINIQGWSGHSVYAVTNGDKLWKQETTVLQFPRERLKFLEKLGKGQFGEVDLCEAMTGSDLGPGEFLDNRIGPRSLLVAVKMLHRNAAQQARAEFQREVEILSRLKDPNIVRVMGVCSQEEPPAVVVEFLKYGDLRQFLLRHLPESSQTMSQTNVLSYGCVIYMATQIASGMKYLESLNMVHRDLATRNCLVGHLYTIKISDFGMSRSLYSSDYYRIEGKAVLPVRWMAWESVLLGKFSTRSDVWSFAVTLWEILTFARELPFQDLTSEQVLENCGHYYHERPERCAVLPQPSSCPKEIFDLMMECWNRDVTQRPSFREIHMFLQRKNMGYDPRVERPVLDESGWIARA